MNKPFAPNSIKVNVDAGASTGSPRLPIYPGFSSQDNTIYRLQRLETGAQRLRGGQIQMTTGSYARIPINTLNTGSSVDLSLSTIRKVGSVPPSGNVSGFAFVGGANSITWYWDGTNGSTVIVLHRSDKSIQVIPTTGSGLVVSGLAVTTKYYFLPYWLPNQKANVGWVQGTVGSPQIAFVAADITSITKGSFYLVQQSLQDREPLTSGFMSATTGSSGGGGDGGGGGKCVMSGTEIVPVGDIAYKLEVHKETDWVRLETEDKRVLFCTHNHPLYHDERGRIVADALVAGDPVLMDDGVRQLKDVDWMTKICSKHSVHMPHGHLFYANGFLSHNQKPFGPP